MIIPVKCFTCGNVIGDKYLYYLEKVIELKKDKNLNHENIQYLTNDEMDQFGKYNIKPLSGRRLKKN